MEHQMFPKSFFFGLFSWAEQLKEEKPIIIFVSPLCVCVCASVWLMPTWSDVLLKCVWVSFEPEAVAEQTHKQSRCCRCLSGTVSEWMTHVCGWLRDGAASRDFISEDKGKVFIDPFLFTLIASAVSHYQTQFVFISRLVSSEEVKHSDASERHAEEQ